MRIRPTAVAGSFYPADPAVLSRGVESVLADAAANADPTLHPKALICPHAGYIYSGATAARGYALLKARADTLRRVILLGPTHRVPVHGMAVPTVDAFSTPLGDVPIDGAARDAALRLPGVVSDDAAHAYEHSLEVQLPFLQRLLGSFTVLPVAVGDATPEAVCRLIETLYGGPETLIVVSSDLSHFHSYAEARKIDADSIEAVLELDPCLDFEQACGATPVNGLLLAAQRHGLSPRLIDLCNSGDTAGDKQRVVGYAAIAFTEVGSPGRPLPVADQTSHGSPVANASTGPSADASADSKLGRALLNLAREAIAARLAELPGGAAAGLSQVVADSDPQVTADRSSCGPALDAPGATFVTLTKNGQLRGCIGSLEAHRPLRTDVRENAAAAAFRDPRFPPLTTEEFSRVHVEVSLLTPAEPLPVIDEADLHRRLRPGVDGIVFRVGDRRATFLPQVWEQLPTPVLFMARLKEKAGFPANYWSDEVRIERYGVRKWKES